MKISSGEECAPLYYRATRRDLIGGMGEMGKGILGLTKKELRRLKRKEKENLWKRNNQRNALPDPVVVHLPKEPPSPARSALQTVHKESAKAREHHCYQGGLNHDWVGFYEKGVSSDQSCINEWNAMDNLESKRPPSPDSLTNKEETEVLIRSKLKEIMMSVDIDEVTSKYIRQRLEDDIQMDLFKFKSFIDREMLTILGQMDAATEIFPHVYLGSEWNASNLDELKCNGVGFILNVTKEIDNFYPGMFDYLNIRVYDDEKTELLRHWDDTYKYINQVKEKGSKVLVHCKMGISRSASVVIAYAMKAHNLSLDVATNMVKAKRGCIKPNQAFTSQLKIYQGILDASRQRHNALFRSKSETNLKSTVSAGMPMGGISSSHLATTRFNYVPRGMQVLPIPDFKPKPTLSSGVALDGASSGTNGEIVSSPREEGAVDLKTTHDLPTTLHVPSLIPGRRPRSWSPDEESANLFNLRPYEDSEFGESLQKSRSLNDQAWQAHVTLVQRDLRDPGGGGMFPEPFVEALNPLWEPRTTPSSPASTRRLEDVLISSSVKERINEFESATSTSAKSGPAAPPKNSPSITSQPSKKGDSPPNLAVTIDDVTTTDSSTDYPSDEGTEEVVLSVLDHESRSPVESLSNSPLPKPEELEAKASGVCRAIAVPRHPPAPSIASFESDLPSPQGSLCNTQEPATPASRSEPSSWLAGLVRKQKEDFEVKGRPRLDDRGRGLTTPKGDPSSIATRVAEVWKCLREDPFSLKVDRVFDREERKDRNNQHPSPPTAAPVPELKRESPSRNSSWGSFDSAVVLPDREPPSRQSSWGSCDTRLSGGSLLSRNSSLGAFDTKLSSTAIIPSMSSTTHSADAVTAKVSAPDGVTAGGSPLLPAPQQQISYVAFCIDKEAPMARRCKSLSRGPASDNLGLAAQDPYTLVGEEGVSVCRSVANAKAYAPMPFRTPAPDKEGPSVAVDPSVENPSPRDSDGEVFFIGSSTSSPYSGSPPSVGIVKRGLKTSPQTPEHEIPLPGTVRQQMHKLENLGAQPASSIGRSLSSGCVCASSALLGAPGPLGERLRRVTRSCSEKRAKSESDEGAAQKGSVRKITRALESGGNAPEGAPLVHRGGGLEVTGAPLSSSSLRRPKQKGKRERPDLALSRSQSLERLGRRTFVVGDGSLYSSASPPTPNKRLSAHPQPGVSISSSQNLLDVLVSQTQEQVVELEKAQEEITVKNLVDLFEDPIKPEKRPQSLSLHGDWLPTPPPDHDSQRDTTCLKRKVRPRSESMGEKELPPVPQRKSSLDYTFRPAIINPGVKGLSHPFITSVLNPPKIPQSSSQGCSRACGSQVMRKKQHGKTHPLSKLTPTQNTL